MNALDRIKKAKVAIMRHKKFCAYSGVMSCGKHTVTDRVPTAATNGWDVMYNPDFIEKYTPTDPELRFLILHECQHIAYRHLSVWRALHEEDAKLANIAADYFVNLSLVEMDNGEGFVKMPSVGIQPDDKYHGWSVKMIFEDLKQQRKGGGGGGGDDDADSPDGDGGFDQHDWENAKGKSQEQIEAEAAEIDRALRQGEMLARKRGQGDGGMDGVFGDLLKPKNDWRQLLREFVQEQCQGRDESTWRKPNRRYIGDDVYMPSMISETMGELVVGIDTSGSCFSGTVITRFVSELTAIIESVSPEKTRVVYWDSGVRGEQVFEHGQFALQNLKPSGGGGTDGSVLFRHMTKNNIRPQAVIQFTDGYVGDWGHTDVPTLWVITERGTRAPFGTTIHMEV